MKRAKRLTKLGKEKIVREISEVFKEHGTYSNIGFIYNNKAIFVGTSEIKEIPDDPKDPIVYTDPEIEIKEDRNPEDYNGVEDMIVITYDGGPLYSIINGEFGYGTWERIQNKLETILGPYHLGIEHINNWSFTLVPGFEPEYKQVARKLARG